MPNMSERRGSSNRYEEMELRRGPWTLEEDTLLIHYIACHGEGRWNHLARCSGLKRTGKSCRLRWLNYLKPDIKRGNLSPEEQLLILELHAKWGNRWSRIAQHLPGRTDNEIKNYWRTRVQKQARQLKIDANSAMFRDAVRCYWMPRLLEKMGSSQTTQSLDANTTTTAYQAQQGPYKDFSINPSKQYHELSHLSPSTSSSCTTVLHQLPAVNMSDLPSRPSHDELDGITFNPSSSGYSMNNAYDLETWDLALMSASVPSYSASDDTVSNNNCSKSVGDSLWSMDELYDILKGYMSGAESKVPFSDIS